MVDMGVSLVDTILIWKEKIEVFDDEKERETKRHRENHGSHERHVRVDVRDGCVDFDLDVHDVWCHDVRDAIGCDVNLVICVCVSWKK